MSLGGCPGTPALPSVPSPVQAPSLPPDPPEVLWDPGEVVLPEPGPAVEDELLSSPMVRHPELRREVGQWVEFWEGAGARWFPEYLERMAWFGDVVDSMLVRRGLPLSLRYLPLIESGFKNFTLEK